MGPRSDRATCGVIAAVWAVTAVLLVTGCPRERDGSRVVRFSITLADDGTSPRVADRKRLVVGPDDVKALGVENPTSFDDFGWFVIDTSRTSKNDEPFTYCIVDPIVITDVDTGTADHTVPAGTCLTEQSPLRIG